ncbi:MAG: histidine phosphatase family protein, partial [Micrococcales bacterium]|nr:histidine phosphatase family protein [Micrococcales bacterium]
MTAGRLLLWRHGRTAANSGGRMQGQIDIPLDEVGYWQAHTAAAALLARYQPTAIVSSNLSRARATADCLARVTGLTVATDERLRERCFGEWEGMTRTAIDERWPGAYEAWRLGGEPSGAGTETREEVAGRVLAAVTSHAAAYGAADTLVITSHGAAISLAIGALLGQPASWRGVMVIRNAHWAELLPARNDDAPAWRLQGLNLGPTDASRDWNAGPDTDPDGGTGTGTGS